jgi:YVTN family beta-propeller protein
MSTKLFCTDTDSGTITVIDPTSSPMTVISKIPVGNSPRGGVMFTASGRGYVGNSAGDFISEIDAISLRETARIKVGIAPMGVGIVPGDDYLLVSNSGSNYVSVVNLTERKEIHQIPVGREPRHMAVGKDGHYAYVAVSGGDYVSKIDISALKQHDPSKLVDVREVARIQVGEGSAPYSVGLNLDATLAIVANNQVAYASLIETSSNSVLAEIDVGNKGGRGAAFAPDGATAFITVEDISEMVAIDVEARSVVNRFPTSPGPRGFAIDPETFRMYIAGFSRTGKEAELLSTPNSVSVVNLAATGFSTMSRARPAFDEVTVGAGPCSVTIFKD